jgi:hypothetical protein
MASTIQSMKAAITTRVNPEDSSRLYYESRALGNPATCPTSAISIDVDEYGRPMGGSGFRTLYLADPACSQFVYSTSRRIKHENAERPILGPCNPGDRGAGDFLYGTARERWPKQIYGPNQGRGDWVSPYTGHMMKPPEGKPVYTTNYPPSAARPLTLSHDALDRPHF